MGRKGKRMAETVSLYTVYYRSSVARPYDAEQNLEDYAAWVERFTELSSDNRQTALEMVLLWLKDECTLRKSVYDN